MFFFTCLIEVSPSAQDYLGGVMKRYFPIYPESEWITTLWLGVTHKELVNQILEHLFIFVMTNR